MLNTKIENFFLSFLPIWPLIAKRWSQIYCHSISMTHSDFLLLFWARSIDSRSRLCFINMHERERSINFFRVIENAFFSVLYWHRKKKFFFCSSSLLFSLWCSKIVKNMVRNGCMKREKKKLWWYQFVTDGCITTLKFKNDKLKNFS